MQTRKWLLIWSIEIWGLKIPTTIQLSIYTITLLKVFLQWLIKYNMICDNSEIHKIISNGSQRGCSRPSIPLTRTSHAGALDTLHDLHCAFILLNCNFGGGEGSWGRELKVRGGEGCVVWVTCFNLLLVLLFLHALLSFEPLSQHVMQTTEPSPWDCEPWSPVSNYIVDMHHTFPD